MQLNPNQNPFPRKIAQSAQIMTMHPDLGLLAMRTEALSPGCPQNHQKRARFIDSNTLQCHFSRIWNQCSLFHWLRPEIARSCTSSNAKHGFREVSILVHQKCGRALNWPHLML